MAQGRILLDTIGHEPSSRSCVFSLYGFAIRSEWRLPAPLLDSCRDSVDIEFRGAPSPFFDPLRTPTGRNSWYSYHVFDDDSAYLRWSELFEFFVSADGRRILANRLTNDYADAFQIYALGQVLSFALINQGYEPIHATVVRVGPDHGIAFLGDSGYGKSTLAATFLAAGYPLLTDDLLVLRPNHGAFLAYPGPARVKLMPETASMFFGPRAEHYPMNNITQKRIIPICGEQVCEKPVKLAAMYVLPDPAASVSTGSPRISALPLAAAFLELTMNTFNRVVETPSRLKRQFEFATAVCNSVPMRALSYARDLSLLPLIRDTILQDVGALLKAVSPGQTPYSTS